MSKKEIIKTEIVDGYTPVHPALDFWDSNAIVAIGEQIQRTYNDDSVDFVDGELCVLNNGDKFIYSKQELATRKLYYSRGLDLPLCRWEHQDIELFCTEAENGNIKSPGFKALHQNIHDLIEHFIDFEDARIYDVLACFVIYTYFYPLFNSAPIIQLWGDMATGKSKTILLLSCLCFNSLNSANISESSVFRIIEGRRATLLLDESEDLMTSERGRAISNLLLAGYSKGGETYRQEKAFGSERYKTASFKVFSPKVIASISGISLNPLLSRMIRIITAGTNDKSKSNRDIDANNKMFQNIRNKLYRLTLLDFQHIIKSRDNLAEHGLTGRTFGIWEGLLTVASLLKNEVWQNVLDYAMYNKEEMKNEIIQSSTGTALLYRLVLLTETHGDDIYTIDDIYNWVKQDDYIEMNTKDMLGKSMGRLNLKSKPRRNGNRIYRTYTLQKDKLLAKVKHQ
jgi:hypothetical protein